MPELLGSRTKLYGGGPIFTRPERPNILELELQRERDRINEDNILGLQLQRERDFYNNANQTEEMRLDRERNERMNAQAEIRNERRRLNERRRRVLEQLMQKEPRKYEKFDIYNIQSTAPNSRYRKKYYI